MTETMPALGAAPPDRQPPRPRRKITYLAVPVAVLVLTGAALAWGFGPSGGTSCSPSLRRLAAVQVARLQTFQTWLRRNHVAGYVGEVGWPGTGPGTQQWNAVAQAWYRQADRDGLWVTAWAAAEGWRRGYKMAIYRLAPKSADGAVAEAQAPVVEAHAHPETALRGVDVPSGAFGTLPGENEQFSNLTPGRYERDYYYPTTAEYRSLAERGFQIVRLGFMWERVQSEPFGPLSKLALRRLEKTIDAAANAGLGVILDMHNFGAYSHASPALPAPRRLVLGSQALPTVALADVWHRLATALRNDAGVVGYDLMNEPRDLAPQAETGARTWERASQQAVTAIRAAGDQRMIAVEAYGASEPEQFVKLQPHAWIHDPDGLIRYEVHQYFDADGSGRYRGTLRADMAAAAAQDPPPAVACRTTT
jgi:hypothetical protein